MRPSMLNILRRLHNCALRDHRVKTSFSITLTILSIRYHVCRCTSFYTVPYGARNKLTALERDDIPANKFLRGERFQFSNKSSTLPGWTIQDAFIYGDTIKLALISALHMEVYICMYSPCHKGGIRTFPGFM